MGFVILWLFFTSCQDVIELDLKNTDPKLVIEATINGTTGQAEVFLSKSNGFYENTQLIAVSNAAVEIVDEDGNVIILTEEKSGYYRSDLNIQPNEIYKLEINSEGEEYEASAMVRTEVALVGLDTSHVVPPFGPPNPLIRIVAKWDDEENEKNYYRLRAYINGKYLLGTYFLISDKAQEGDTILAPIQNPFSIGDTVKVELMNVSKDYYNYFLDLSAIQGGGPTNTTTFNPRGNFGRRALGFFGIYYSSELEIVL